MLGNVGFVQIAPALLLGPHACLMARDQAIASVTTHISVLYDVLSPSSQWWNPYYEGGAGVTRGAPALFRRRFTLERHTLTSGQFAERPTCNRKRNGIVHRNGSVNSS